MNQISNKVCFDIFRNRCHHLKTNETNKCEDYIKSPVSFFNETRSKKYNVHAHPLIHHDLLALTFNNSLHKTTNKIFSTMYPMLTVFLDCPPFILHSVLSNVHKHDNTNIVFLPIWCNGHWSVNAISILS